MRTLRETLRDSDAALLAVLAELWRVSVDSLDTEEAVEALAGAMLDESQVEAMWNRLDDEQRGVLQALAGSQGGMPAPMFNRAYGEFRKMGRGQIEKEQPQHRPQSVAESLYYRGLIAESFKRSKMGIARQIYIPTDLIEALPLHQTTYDNLDDEDFPLDDYTEGAGGLTELDPDAITNFQAADTSIVDDMTTLLAYLQTHDAAATEDSGVTLSEDDQQALLPYLLRSDPHRLAFMMDVGISAGLIHIENGQVFPKRAEARRWLSAARTPQVKWLADAWNTSTQYLDLWHVPGLYPEPAGAPYEPVIGRAALVSFLLEFAPAPAWWSLDDFVMLVKETEPDFQRPGGDYESWYIRNDAGDYLIGFESWEAVEGALLEFYLMGPMHWLGLVDTGDDAVRLTAYGRAFVSGEVWPSRPETDEKIIVQPDGMLLASRKVPRVDRFQLARFTVWDQPGDPYHYRLTGESIHQAGQQGINTNHIAAFLKRQMDNQPLPPGVARLLSTWQAGATTQATLERLLVLRTHAPEVLDKINDEPALRRYLGARLGPMAVIVRADQWEALRDALGEQGIAVEVMGI